MPERAWQTGSRAPRSEVGVSPAGDTDLAPGKDSRLGFCPH